MENKLVIYPSQTSGVMTQQEFTDAADSLLAVTNEKLMLSSYKEAATYVTQMDHVDNGVPILRLARKPFFFYFAFFSSIHIVDV